VRWTKEPPTESGWYWYRHALSSQPQVFEARDTKDGISIYYDQWRPTFYFEGEWWPEKIEPPEND